MESKYYTPEIEEFHIGFECEVLNNNNFESAKIILQIIDNNLAARFNKKNILIEIVLTEESLSRFRVKHLDQDDIIECGWEQIEYDSFKIGSFILELNNEYKTFIYLEKDKDNVFVGKIKNKSELRKLMQQLNINSGGN
jgi:hypothetical protein